MRFHWKSVSITILAALAGLACFTSEISGQVALWPSELLPAQLTTYQAVQLGLKQQTAALVDFAAVQADLKTLFKNSQDFWPADFGHYGPFFIRLAWHCAGSYRIFDGRGGCDGGRQRFDPERSWADNTNLDKARKLLQPIKVKYGDGLSWGDLMILAGSTAIQDMGGPFVGFCGGRTDDANGAASLKLGPTAEQAAIFNCTNDGNCTSPLGATTLGLIYVNPEGPFGVPNPNGTFPLIRDTFGRMNMNDTETVALIGGGHAFGKTHGACPLGPGPAPNVQPSNPWPGLCGNGTLKGKSNNTFTSGFEGPWTHNPIVWSNEYFVNLLNFNWTLTTGPGGHFQWNTTDPTLMMLTADISLLQDPSYLAIVQAYANDTALLANAFGHAWYKLVSRDMGPVTRCGGNLTASAQNFQFPLPAVPAAVADATAVRTLISTALTNNPDKIPSVIHLAYQCSSTFRQTDYLGGCNGARIRFTPGSTWSVNAGTSTTLSFLQTNVLDLYTGTGTLTYADLIVHAGQIAVEQASGQTLSFCAGRSDATDGASWEFLTPRVYNDSDVPTTLLHVRDLIEISGMIPAYYIALQGRIRSDAQQQAIGYSGAWGGSTTKLTNAFFTTLIGHSWVLQQSTSGKNEYKASDATIYITPQDIALVYDSEYNSIVQAFAANNTLFLEVFAKAWVAQANADMFAGPYGNKCTPTVATATTTTTTTNTFSAGALGGGIAGAFVGGCLIAGIIVFFCGSKKDSGKPAIGMKQTGNNTVRM